MGVKPIDLEALAEATYDLAGLSTELAVTPLYLARELLNRIEWVEGLTSVVMLRGNALSIQAEAPQRLVDWRVSRALAFWTLRKHRQLADDTRVDSLAACLRTPRKAFRRVADMTGADFGELARIFGISESAAALRFGETMGARIMLLVPDRAPRVRGRGPAKAPVRVLPLTDAPGRQVRLYAVG